MKTHSIFTTTLSRNVWCVAAALALAACSSSNAPSKRAVADGHYRVKPGDTLYRIAKRYGQSVHTLAAWNNLSDASKIEVGQVLRVRRGGSARTVHARSNTRNTAAARPVAPINRIRLQWPTDAAAANIVQRYNGVTSKGIDIAGQRGQAVKAVAGGKVLYVGEGVRGYGKLILLSHNNSTITAYAHNDTLLVRDEQSVSAGQTIATMGSSDTDRVKLHFEVRINGKAVDPIPYLQY